MVPKTEISLIAFLTSAVLFLLEERVKQHPTSNAAGTARSLSLEIVKARDVKPLPLPEPKFRPTGELMIKQPPVLDPSPRVPIATDYSRYADEGEDSGARPGSPGTEADLL